MTCHVARSQVGQGCWVLEPVYRSVKVGGIRCMGGRLGVYVTAGTGYV